MAALLAGISIVVYLPALNGAYLWDECLSIHDNPFLRPAGGIWPIWSTIGQIPGESHYWPMTYSVLWLETQLWGGRLAGFHFLNFALHAGVVVQMWRLARRIGLPGAMFGAALFAVHPVHAEAVAWIISVKDLLATLFSLLAVELYLNHEERGGWKWLALATVAFIAALLSKSSAATVPFGLAILAWYQRGRLMRRDLIGLGILAAIAFVIVVTDTRIVRLVNVTERHVIPPLLARVPQAAMAFWFYASKLVWPANLGPIYPAWPLRGFAQWIPLAAIVLATGALWIARDKIGRGPLACWLFYGVMLAPTLGIIWFNFLEHSPVADRYQYFASMAPLAGFGALAGWCGKRFHRPILKISAFALVIALASLTWRQAGYYRGPEAFFGHAVEIAPESHVVYYNLGTAACRRELFPEAERFFTKAYRLKPDNDLTIYSLGLVLAVQDKYAEAIEFYEKALERGCMYPMVWSKLEWLLVNAPEPYRNPERAKSLAAEYAARGAGKRLVMPGAF